MPPGSTHHKQGEAGISEAHVESSFYRALSALERMHRNRSGKRPPKLLNIGTPDIGPEDIPVHPANDVVQRLDAVSGLARPESS